MGTTVDAVFEAVIERLRTQSLQQATRAVENGGNQFVQTGDGAPLDGMDHDAIKQTFSRDSIAKAYSDALDNPAASYRDAQAAKVQSDVLSAMERDLRMRYRPRVRQLAHATGRLMTHGRQHGGFGGMLQHVRMLIDRG